MAPSQQAYTPGRVPVVGYKMQSPSQDLYATLVDNYTLASPERPRPERPRSAYWDQYPPNDSYWATGPSYPRVYRAPDVLPQASPWVVAAAQPDIVHEFIVPRLLQVVTVSQLQIRIQGLFLPLALSLSLSLLHAHAHTNNHARKVRSETRTLRRGSDTARYDNFLFLEEQIKDIIITTPRWRTSA